MKITEEALKQHRFILTETALVKAWVRQIAAQTVLRFGGMFNGALELEFPDGNDGAITLVPRIESWDDIDALARMFAAIPIDTGHTLHYEQPIPPSPSGHPEGITP